MTISRKQLAVLHVGKAKLGLADEDYRAILTAIGGVTSAADLDARGFDAVMARFRQLGFVSDAKRSNFGKGERRGMATAAQIALINSLWGEVAEDANARDLDRWLARFFKVSALRFVDYATAHRAIGALRQWKERRAHSPP